MINHVIISIYGLLEQIKVKYLPHPIDIPKIRQNITEVEQSIAIWPSFFDTTNSNKNIINTFSISYRPD